MNGDRHFIRRFSDLIAPPVGADGAPRIRASRQHSSYGHQPFRPLPAPTGPYPYHLSLSGVLPPGTVGADPATSRLVFHVVGDSGGVKTPVPQMNVAHQMELDLARGVDGLRPSFFYHLGDVVYFYGEAAEYYPQFYDAYAQYDAPIFAIPGNHDGDLSYQMQQESVPSLDAFVHNFCAPIPHHTPDAVDAQRSAMNQPNVYWTLESPVATIVGLYTNVPDGGRLDDDQIAWLKSELASAPRDRFLLVAMHHPIFSIDDHHSGSLYMRQVLDEAVAETQRRPDAVFAGHVHNYQRFTRDWDGQQVPFIVAGAGGYHNLHHVSKPMTESLLAGAVAMPYALADDSNATFVTYCDDRFGFLRLDLTADTLKGEYHAVRGFGDPATTQSELLDAFTLDRQTGKVSTTETLAGVASGAKHSSKTHPRG